MGIWDGIAAVGLAGRGYDDADRRYRDRDSDTTRQQMADMALKEAMRKDELSTGLRDAIKAVGPRAAAKGLDVTTPVENDPYGEGYVRTDPGIDVPADQNRMGRAKAGADFLEGQGDLDGADRYRKVLKAMEDEGYKSVVVGVAAGKSPQEIAEQFNQVGKKRIVGGATDGKTYRFKYEDGTEGTYERDKMRELANAHGFLKKPESRVMSPGSSLEVDGKIVATAPDRAPKPARDYVAEKKAAMDYALQNKKDYAKWEAEHFAGSDAKAPAKIREINSLIKDFGMTPEEAKSLAYGINRNAKTPEERVLRWAQVMKNDPNLMDSDKLMEAATRMAAAFADRSVAEPPASAPKASPAPPAAAPQGNKKPYAGAAAPTKHPSAKKAPDGFWYIKKPNGGFARVLED